MCQIIGHNSSTPTSFANSFHKFCDRGGCEDIHKDGWGVCVYKGRGIRTFYDTTACCHSSLARYVQDYFATHPTNNLLAHIRYATHGNVSLENLHPFVRELWGISWCFAHNGDVCRFAHTTTTVRNHRVQLGNVSSSDDLSYHPIGDTDSEAIFCAILNALRKQFRELPTLAVLHAFLATLCDDIVGNEKDVIFNFILLCGPCTLFAYSWPGQLATSNTWNGLYYLVSQSEVDTKNPTEETGEDATMLPRSLEVQHTATITTKPLTEEKGWIEMKPGELLMFDRGVPYSTASELDAVECEGHGLSSHRIPKTPCLACPSRQDSFDRSSR